MLCLRRRLCNEDGRKSPSKLAGGPSGGPSAPEAVPPGLPYQKSNCALIFQKRGCRIAVGSCHVAGVVVVTKPLFRVRIVFEFVAL